MNNLIDNLKTNNYVRTDCIDTTLESKKCLLDICNQYNIKYEEANDRTDMYDHIDCFLSCNNMRFSIDYKSSKILLDEKTNPLNEWVWIEFKNVRGDDGWIYGKADYIVWVLKNQLWFVNRKNLLQFTLRKLKENNNQHTDYKNDANYKWYKRFNRNDLITKISLLDIKNNLNPKIFRKALDNI
jgi:hypothetical protein